MDLDVKTTCTPPSEGPLGKTGGLAHELRVEARETSRCCKSPIKQQALKLKCVQCVQTEQSAGICWI